MVCWTLSKLLTFVNACPFIYVHIYSTLGKYAEVKKKKTPEIVDNGYRSKIGTLTTNYAYFDHFKITTCVATYKKQCKRVAVLYSPTSYGVHLTGQGSFTNSHGPSQLQTTH